jgi:DNA-directed RNA polymerase specialized sigma24 family protein
MEKEEALSPEMEDFDKAFKDYANKLRESGKKFCHKCFDTRDLKQDGCSFLCRDCKYMMDLLDHISKTKN